MAYTVSQCFRDWAALLGLSQSYVATGGSTTTAILGNWSSIVDNAPEEDEFVDWTLVVDRDAGGAAAAPEGEFNRINDYADVTYTFTVDTAFTAAIASGDRITLVKPTIKLEQFRSTLNQSLRNLGMISLANTSVDILDDTYTYNLSAGVRTIHHIEVYDSNAVRYPMPRNAWSLTPYAAGGTAVLYIQPSHLPASADSIRIYYEGFHAAVNAFNDEISDTIKPPVIAAQVAYDCLKLLPQSSQLWQDKYQIVTGEINAMITKHGGYPMTPKSDPKILTLRGDYNTAGKYGELL